MMIDINKKLHVAKQCFERWSQEQDTTSPMYYSRAEDFFSRHLYDDLVDLQQYPSTDIGEYVKSFMKYVNNELQAITDEEEQRALERRKQLNL